MPTLCCDSDVILEVVKGISILVVVSVLKSVAVIVDEIKDSCSINVGIGELVNGIVVKTDVMSDNDVVAVGEFLGNEVSENVIGVGKLVKVVVGSKLADIITPPIKHI